MSNCTPENLGRLFRIKHGYAFKGEYFSTSGPFIVLTPGNFFDAGGFKHKGKKEKHYTGPIPDGYVLEKGDLIVAMTEQAEGLLGSAALIPGNDRYLHNQRLGRIVDLDKGKLDKKFLYYLFNTPLVRAQIRATANGAKVRHTSPARIYEVEVDLPALLNQRRIAAILSAYDDLIENNTRRIEILEEMARRLYEEWFVHFRFPGYEQVSFKESELGRIPEGWEVTSVKPLIKRLKNGTVYKQKDIEASGSTIVIDQSRSEYLGFHSNEPDHQASEKRPVIVFGDHTCKMQIMVIPFSLGPNTIAFTSKTGHSLYYIFSLVKGLIKTQEYKRHWSDFMDKAIIAAPVELSLEYAETVEPMFRQIEILRRKDRNLRAQRDLLLPKLVSGEIDVSDISMPDDKEFEAA